MQYDDLTPYRYNPNWVKDGALNVGWLGSSVPSCETPSQDFLDRLCLLCCEPTHLMRGFHSCEICGANPMADDDPFFQKYGHRLGNGEVWIDSISMQTFVSPTMIFHYVSDHFYSPPRQYIEAVMHSDRS